MRLETALIAALLLPAFLGAAAAPSLPAPTGVTLSVDAAETGLLTWEPSDREDLMGYSVWMRQGYGEFTRLNIPTLVGKEIKKLPMTAKSALTLKGIGKRDVEVRVVAEYESGRSQASASAFSRRARRTAPAASPAGAPQDSTSTAAPMTTETPVPAKDEAASEPGSGPLPSPRRSVMAPKGGFHSSLLFAFAWEVTDAKGYNSMNEMGTYVVGEPDFDLDRHANWIASYTKSGIQIPLTLEYGLLQGLEAGGEIAYAQEKVYESKFDFGDRTFKDYNASTAVEGSGFTNPIAKLRLQPSQALPLRIGVKAAFATGGRSRLQSWGEYLLDISKEAGVDDNTGRVEMGLDFGNPGVDKGLSYSLSYKPSAGESARINTSFGPLEMRLEHGAEFKGGFGYTFPWGEAGMPGSLGAGLSLRSIDPGRWLVSGKDAGPGLSNYGRAAFRAYTGVNLAREDQLTLFVSLYQNLFSAADRHGALVRNIDSGGRLEYTLKPDGWILSLSGGFYY